MTKRQKQQSTVDDTNSHLPKFVAPNYDTLNEIVITQQDVIKAIKESNAKKASGPDGISPKPIKEGKQELARTSISLHQIIQLVNKASKVPI